MFLLSLFFLEEILELSSDGFPVETRDNLLRNGQRNVDFPSLLRKLPSYGRGLLPKILRPDLPKTNVWVGIALKVDQNSVLRRNWGSWWPYDRGHAMCRALLHSKRPAVRYGSGQMRYLRKNWKAPSAWTFLRHIRQYSIPVWCAKDLSSRCRLYAAQRSRSGGVSGVIVYCACPVLLLGTHRLHFSSSHWW